MSMQRETGNIIYISRKGDIYGLSKITRLSY